MDAPESEVDFIAKYSSTILDCNISAAKIEVEGGITVIAVTLFHADGERELDSFGLGTPTHIVEDLEKLFAFIEDSYIDLLMRDSEWYEYKH